MLCYSMIWKMRLYAMVWDSNAMLWDFNAMLWDFNAMLCYGVCCKRYAWTDCTPVAVEVTRGAIEINMATKCFYEFTSAL